MVGDGPKAPGGLVAAPGGPIGAVEVASLMVGAGAAGAVGAPAGRRGIVGAGAGGRGAAPGAVGAGGAPPGTGGRTGAAIGTVAEGTAGGASAAFKVTRTVSFFRGTLVVCRDGSCGWFSLSLMRARGFECLTWESKKCWRPRVKLPAREIFEMMQGSPGIRNRILPEPALSCGKMVGWPIPAHTESTKRQAGPNRGIGGPVLRVGGPYSCCGEWN